METLDLFFISCKEPLLYSLSVSTSQGYCEKMKGRALSSALSTLDEKYYIDTVRFDFIKR